MERNITMIKLSVIVPIYNVEKYLLNCLQSIDESIDKDCEVILINDGSTDSSQKICASYILDKPNFKLINQENRGLSAARNTGIHNSIGEYISFIDSDDWVSKDYFKMILANITNKPDVLVFGYTNVNENTGNIDIHTIDNNYYEINEIGKAILDMESRGYVFNLAWNKAYKRNKVTSYFEEGISYCEDLLFNCVNFKNINTIITISNLLYNYRTTNNSLTNNKFYKNYDELMNLSINHRKQLYAYFDLLKKDGKDIYFQKCVELYLASITNMYRLNSTFNLHQRIEKLNSIKSSIKTANYVISDFSNNEKLCFKIVTQYPSYVSDFLFLFLFFIKNRCSFLYYKINKGD